MRFAAGLFVALVVLGAGPTKRARADTPVVLAETQAIPLPGVQKRIDHFAVDPGGKRLFVAALGNGTLEVLDLAGGKRITSVSGLSEPQGVAYLPELHRIVVATHGGAVVSFDDTDYHRVATIPKMDDADNLRIDDATKQLWVGYRDGALGLIDPASMKVVANVALPGHPESFRLETSSPRVFVNVPPTHEILVVDRNARAITAHIPLPGFASNYPMALDESGHRLFVGVRHPARLLVFDTTTNKALAAVPCVGDTDDVFFDAKRNRVYVIGGEGFVDTYDANPAGKYERIMRLPTRAGARTGLWSPELDELFVGWPARDGRAAEIEVLTARP